MLLALTSDELLLLIPDALLMFLAVWLFAVGGCVGSFINVVALRLPEGMSIARSGSRCPGCLHPIRWYDNIPLVSWIRLRGRCRDCGTWIPVRYPCVELLVATIFVTLGLGEGLIGGRNLPLPPDAPRYYVLTAFENWSIFTYHIVLLVTLFTASLIAWDGHKVARQIFLPALLIGGTAPLFLPGLHPVAFAQGVVGQGALGGLYDSLCGLLGGVCAGFCVWPAVTRPGSRPPAGHLAVFASALCGMFLGWQLIGLAAVLATVSFLILTLLASCTPYRRAGPWPAYLTVSCLFLILRWGTIAERIPAVGPDGTIGGAAVFALLVLSIALGTRWIMRNREPSRQTRVVQGDVMAALEPDEQLKAILASPSYLPVEYDAQFLQQPEIRPVRVQLELLKPELGFSREGVDSTVVVFGGTQVVEAEAAQRALEHAQLAWQEAPHDRGRQRDVQRCERIVAKACYYDAAREFSRLVSSHCQIDGKCDYVIVTGGGPGIMEAANRGAYDVGAKSIGLNVTLPEEQVPNPFITPDLCFQFHYFALRKMHFLMRARRSSSSPAVSARSTNCSTPSPCGRHSGCRKSPSSCSAANTGKTWSTSSSSRTKVSSLTNTWT